MEERRQGPFPGREKNEYGHGGVEMLSCFKEIAPNLLLKF